jgi:hypothetical protein
MLTSKDLSATPSKGCTRAKLQSSDFQKYISRFYANAILKTENSVR